MSRTIESSRLDVLRRDFVAFQRQASSQEFQRNLHAISQVFHPVYLHDIDPWDGEIARAVVEYFAADQKHFEAMKLWSERIFSFWMINEDRRVRQVALAVRRLQEQGIYSTEVTL